MKLSLPIHIQKLSKRWYKDVPNNRFVKFENLEAYLKERKEIVSGEKDKAIRNVRWDLNY